MKSGRTLKLADVPPYEALLDAVERLWSDYKRGKFKWFERGVEDLTALRDVALFTVLVFTGCRLGEALALTREDVDVKRRVVRIRQLKKKAKEFVRTVPVPSSLFWEVMERYLNKTATDRLFTITDRGARDVVYRIAECYLKRRLRPHAIRHSYAIAVLKATKNLEVVRRLLGHEDYDTVKVYLDLSQEDLEEELAKVFERTR